MCNRKFISSTFQFSSNSTLKLLKYTWTSIEANVPSIALGEVEGKCMYLNCQVLCKTRTVETSVVRVLKYEPI